jgi:hypothetical protein
MASHLADDETEAEWRKTARPPDFDSWSDLIVGLREAQVLEQQNVAVQRLTPKMTSAEHALRKVLEFLDRQHGVAEPALQTPLRRLLSAISDLGRGRIDPMLKPTARPPGNPGHGIVYETLMGFSARALKEFIAAKPRDPQAKKDAAKRIAALLKKTRPAEFGKIDAKTVINWYERLERGSGPGAPHFALMQYKEPLPVGWGSDPSDRAEIMLEAIQANAATRI